MFQNHSRMVEQGVEITVKEASGGELQAAWHGGNLLTQVVEAVDTAVVEVVDTTPVEVVVEAVVHTTSLVCTVEVPQTQTRVMSQSLKCKLHINVR
jgi:hypothetical protein